MIMATLVAGILAGILFSVAEQILTVPIIIEAETYESAAEELLSEPEPELSATTKSIDSHEKGSGHAHDNNHETSHKADHGNGGHSHASSDSHSGFAGLSERTLYTLLASILTGITFALLLASAMTFHGKGNARIGILWGIAGYIAFFVSPSLGLLPELPGSTAAAIEHRQLWWIATVIATITGLALLVFAKKPLLKAIGLPLLVIPHIIGAPMPEAHIRLAPDALVQAFIWMTALANFILWIALGVLTGFLLSRLKVISTKIFD